MEDNFLCPINQTVMVDPVSTCDGHTYERAAIQEWFRLNPHNTRSPCTNLPLANKTLRPNHVIKKCIDDSKDAAAVGAKRNLQEAMQAVGGSKRAKTPEVADPLVLFQLNQDRLMINKDVAGIVECWRTVVGTNVALDTKVFSVLLMLTDARNNAPSEQFVASGGVQLLVDSMTIWRASTALEVEVEVIYRGACGVLERITRVSRQSGRLDHMFAIEQAGGIEAVVLALQEHCGNVHLVKSALEALQNFADITAPGTVAFAHKVIDAGGMQAVAMNAMGTHAANDTVVYSGCRLLRTLAGFPCGLAKVTASGALAAVIRVFSLGVVRVNSAACDALRVFCGCQEIASSPQSAAVACLTFQLLKKPDGDEWYGFWRSAIPALELLVRGHAENKSVARSHLQGTFRVLEAMNRGTSIIRSHETKLEIVELSLGLVVSLLPDTCSDGDFSGVIAVLDVIGLASSYNSLKLSRHLVQIVIVCLQYQRYDIYNHLLRRNEAIHFLTRSVRNSVGASLAPLQQASLRSFMRLNCLALLLLCTVQLSDAASRSEKKDVVGLRAAVVSKVVETGGIEAVVAVVAHEAVTGGPSAGVMHKDARAALLLLPKLCHSYAHYSRVEKADGLKAILACLSLYKDVESVVLVCMDALSGTFGHSWELRTFDEVGLQSTDVELVVCVMKLHATNVGIQHAAMAVLGFFSYASHRVLKNRFVFPEAKAALTTVGDAGAVPPVLAAMKAYPDDVKMQWEACQVLSQYMRVIQASDRDKFGAAVACLFVDGAHDAVFAAFQTHSASPVVRLFACYFLASVCCHDEYRPVITAAGGVAVALSSLQDATSSGSGLCGAFMLLGNIVSLKDGNLFGLNQPAIDAISAGSGMKIIVDAIPTATAKTDISNESKRDLLRSACRVLLAMTTDDAQCVHFALQGGIQVLLQVMKLDKVEKGLHVKMMLEVLARVSEVSSLVMSVATAGGVQVVIECMRVCVGPPAGGAQHSASVILCNLAQDPSLHAFMKDPQVGVLAWVDGVLKGSDDMSKTTRERYIGLRNTLA